MTAIKVKPGSVFSIPYLKFLVDRCSRRRCSCWGGWSSCSTSRHRCRSGSRLWVVSFSIATYGVYAYDKAQAQAQGLRVPEIVLHVMEALGGTPGAFVAMRVLHHKNRKRDFQVVFWLIVAAQVGFLVLVLVPALRQSQLFACSASCQLALQLCSRPLLLQRLFRL